MPIPKFKYVILPFLNYLKDDDEHHIKEIEDALTKELKISVDELAETTPSGRMGIFSNRVRWAGTYLNKAGLVERPKRGLYKITNEGQKVLLSKPEIIDPIFLSQFSSFNEFQNGDLEEIKDVEPSENIPEEIMDSSLQRITEELKNELLIVLKSQSPKFFEDFVVDLLLKMGYGGSRKDAGKAIGKTGDEGIDGIINEDKLGLDSIYIQAKRWEGSVGRPDIMQFVGALAAKHARKGIFITTSKFSQEALSYVKVLDVKVVLIDGDQLAKLMIEHGVGVQVVTTYEIKKIDSDYFIEE